MSRNSTGYKHLLYAISCSETKKKLQNAITEGFVHNCNNRIGYRRNNTFATITDGEIEGNNYRRFEAL